LILRPESATGESIIWVYQEYLYDLQENYNHSAQTYDITIPSIYTITADTKGIFHIINIEELRRIIQKIKQEITVTKIIYHIGWKRLIVETNQKRLFFHVKKNVSHQINKRKKIQTHYQEIENIKEIDLSSGKKTVIKL
jgi:hypothetical protein